LYCLKLATANIRLRILRWADQAMAASGRIPHLPFFKCCMAGPISFQATTGWLFISHTSKSACHKHRKTLEPHGVIHCPAAPMVQLSTAAHRHLSLDMLVRLCCRAHSLATVNSKFNDAAYMTDNIQLQLASSNSLVTPAAAVWFECNTTPLHPYWTSHGHKHCQPLAQPC